MILEAGAIATLERFEATLDPAHPETGEVPAKVVGYGEMSTVVAIDAPGLADLVLKRMAIFHDEGEVDAYEELLADYAVELRAAGLTVPDQASARTTSGRTGRPVLYLLQARLDGAAIGNKVLATVPLADRVVLVRSVLAEITRVFARNRDLPPGGPSLGLDGQISNWCVEGFDSRTPAFTGDERLVYLDTGTPLIRRDGVEAIDPELFLRLCPASLAWVVRRFFLQDVLDRYHDCRGAVLDMVANLVKEGHDDLVDAAVGIATDVLRSGWDRAVDPVTAREVRSYYREDKQIWRLFLGLRRLERFVQTGVRHKPYDAILPGRIKR